MRDIYIAAPFFNPHELAVVEGIFAACRGRRHISAFSPYHYNQSIQANLQDAAVRKKIFDDNVRELRECTEVLAWIDRSQMDAGVYLCREKDEQRTVGGLNPRLMDPTGAVPIAACNLEPFRGPLKQPDLGTVWELGYCHALQKRCTLFTLEPPGSTVNLMLAEGAAEVVHGWDELDAFLNRQAWELPTMKEPAWKGGVE